MGTRRFFTSLAAAGLLAATPAAAQFSDSYNFLKAVRDADGAKTMTFLNKPGAPALAAKDYSTGESALHIVVKRHDATWIAFLLSRGANPNARDNDGATPLFTAAMLGNPETAQLLLQGGASVDLANNAGETPLIRAVQRRDMAVIRVLLAGGADPKRGDRVTGKSARDYAAEDSRSAGIVKLLDEAKPKAPGRGIAGPVMR